MPSSVIELSSTASTKPSGRAIDATVTPGRSGFSIGAASASAASMRASTCATLPTVTAPKLWPITPTVEPSNSCAIARGITGSSDITASIARSTSPTRRSRVVVSSGRPPPLS